MKKLPSHPDYVIALEKIYGSASQGGFGSAVFYEKRSSQTDLDEIALHYYRYFIGDLWERYGENSWMSEWKKIYTRTDKTDANVVKEMSGISDLNVKSLTLMLLEVGENPQNAQETLSLVYDDVNLQELSIYRIGDGAAMSGLLIAGKRENKEIVILSFLLD